MADLDETQNSRKFAEITETLRRQRVDLERAIQERPAEETSDLLKKLAELRERAEKTSR